MQEILYRRPEALIAGALLACMATAGELGERLGRRGGRAHSEPARAQRAQNAFAPRRRTMNSLQARSAVSSELDHLTQAFFDAVSFEQGDQPRYHQIRELFVEQGLLIKNSGPVPEISSLDAFIAPRQASVNVGDLTRFHEAELSETTQVFGNVAQRFSTYVKSGTLKGATFEAKGMISTQFIRTPHGWRMSSMAWDDERPGLVIPERTELPSLA